MKTTLNLDDELYRQVKAKAAMEGQRVTDLVEAGLRVVLGESASDKPRATRVRLPLIPARPGQGKIFDGMTADRIHQYLADLEAGSDLEAYEVSLPEEGP
jgi:hypothetical protein